jgi:hypothetical protein
MIEDILVPLPPAIITVFITFSNFPVLSIMLLQRNIP